MTEILTIGNAICDLLCKVSDDIIDNLDLVKGSMILCDIEQINNILDILKKNNFDFVLSSGGSAANTAFLLKMQNINAAFIGNVANDYYGKKYADELDEAGVKFLNVNNNLNSDTAKSIILITPDGERTMCTYLGCASDIMIKDGILEEFSDLKYIYLEGYLWDNNNTVNEIIPFIEDAKSKNIKIAFSLSDSFCVERNFEKFHFLCDNYVDLIFANEDEIKSCYNIDLSEPSKIKILQDKIKNSNIKSIIITKNIEGAVVILEEEYFNVPTRKLKAIDSTGAGDSFAAGFLAKIVKKNDFFSAANNANYIAGQIVVNMGARPNNLDINSDLNLCNEVNN